MNTIERWLNDCHLSCCVLRFAHDCIPVALYHLAAYPSTLTFCRDAKNSLLLVGTENIPNVC